MSPHARLLLALAMATAAVATIAAQAQTPTALDTRVRTFLDDHRGTWQDLNVPEADGQTLHDLIVARHFTRALEIGTSTGHSGIWIGWALAKTGGHLLTIDIDGRRQAEARANFDQAGVRPQIELRLGDAHEIVPRLDGPFDVVFSDADKDWYTRYFEALWPKVAPGGCFTAHNVSGRGMSGIGEFLERLRRVTDGTTTIDTKSSAGLSITCKAK
jgi:predicted O-methyltransferase YrrM